MNLMEGKKKKFGMENLPWERSAERTNPNPNPAICRLKSPKEPQREIRQEKIVEIYKTLIFVLIIILKFIPALFWTEGA